ncbi:NAD(P)-dependent oxidoreductase, partial [candidate division KSB1 bacterium]
FLDELITHPNEEGKAKQMLDELAVDSNGEIEIVYRCDRNPEEPLQIEELEGVTAVIADLESYDREILSKAGIKAGGSLGLISRYGIGYSSVDVESVTKYGVILTNAPGCNALPTAEWTQSTILDIAGRRILHYNTASAGKPKEGPSRLDITGKTLGVIGTGTIGRYVVNLMKGFNMKVIAYDIYPNEEWAVENNVTYTDLKYVCKNADIITLHASSSLTIIQQEEIDLMKPTTVLVNCARGILVDNRAVYNAVKDGKIWGYGLDEIWLEKDLSLDGLNIIVSPHVGSDTDMGKIGMQVMSTEAVIDFMNGRTPKHVVNKDVLLLLKKK